TAAVYSVSRIRDQKAFVAKVIFFHRFAPSNAAIERFEREARIQGDINHQNVIRIQDIVRHGAYPILILQRAACGFLYERLRSLSTAGAVAPPSTALHWTWQILRGARALHWQGVVHQDLTPKNLLFLEKNIGRPLAAISPKAVPPPERGPREHTGVF